MDMQTRFDQNHHVTRVFGFSSRCGPGLAEAGQGVLERRPSALRPGEGQPSGSEGGHLQTRRAA